jgi:hypothetical protein
MVPYLPYLVKVLLCDVGRVASVATELRAGRSGDRIQVGARFSVCPEWPRGPHSLLYNGYRVLPRGKERPRRAADHSPLSSDEVMED